MTIDTYVQVMLAFIDPKANREEWLGQMNKAEEFLSLAENKFESFNAKVFVSRFLPYPEFVEAVTGNNRPAEATKLFELFWKEHSDLKFEFGDWKPPQPFPAQFCQSLKLLYAAWNQKRKKAEDKMRRRGKKFLD
jgi:hypothetical protein